MSANNLVLAFSVWTKALTFIAIESQITQWGRRGVATRASVGRRGIEVGDVRGIAILQAARHRTS